MRLLLDTHILLWWLTLDRQMPRAIDIAIRSGSNDVAVSAVSVWEITIKRGRGLLEMDIDDVLMAIAADRFTELPVRFGDALHLSLLPDHHLDPFDRMLIAQALSNGRRLVTTDAKILKYAGEMGFDPLTA